MTRAILWQLLLVASLAALCAPVAYSYAEAVNVNLRQVIEAIP